MQVGYHHPSPHAHPNLLPHCLDLLKVLGGQEE